MRVYKLRRNRQREDQEDLIYANVPWPCVSLTHLLWDNPPQCRLRCRRHWIYAVDILHNRRTRSLHLIKILSCQSKTFGVYCLLLFFIIIILRVIINSWVKVIIIILDSTSSLSRNFGVVTSLYCHTSLWDDHLPPYDKRSMISFRFFVVATLAPPSPHSPHPHTHRIFRRC